MVDLAINIVRKCNLDCPHCFITREGPEISFEKIKKAVEIIKPTEVTLSGGEPFLHKDVQKILSYLDSQKCTINIYTNGYLITDKRIENLLRLKSVVVYISDHSDYQGTRQNHEHILENAKKLVYRGVTVGINKLFTETVLGYLDSFLKKFNFVDRIMFQYPTPAGAANVEIISPEKWEEMINIIKGKARKIKCPRIFYEPAFARSDEDWEDLVCVSGEDVYMDSNGHSHACCLSVDAMKGFDYIGPVKLEPSDCNSCGGGCPILNNMYGHDPRCNYKGYIPICPVIVHEAGKMLHPTFPGKINSTVVIS